MRVDLFTGKLIEPFEILPGPRAELQGNYRLLLPYLSAHIPGDQVISVAKIICESGLSGKWTPVQPYGLLPFNFYLGTTPAIDSLTQAGWLDIIIDQGRFKVMPTINLIKLLYPPDEQLLMISQLPLYVTDATVVEALVPKQIDSGSLLVTRQLRSNRQWQSPLLALLHDPKMIIHECDGRKTSEVEFQIVQLVEPEVLTLLHQALMSNYVLHLRAHDGEFQVSLCWYGNIQSPIAVVNHPNCWMALIELAKTYVRQAEIPYCFPAETFESTMPNRFSFISQRIDDYANISVMFIDGFFRASITLWSESSVNDMQNARVRIHWGFGSSILTALLNSIDAANFDSKGYQYL